MAGAFPFTCTLLSPANTAALAAQIAPLLRAGDTLLLDGDIGSGKTHFARAAIQARLAKSGRAEDVPSPTYTLVQTYHDGIVDIWHADLFRLTGPDEVADLGLDDAFSEAVCFVEWPDRLDRQPSGGAITINFQAHGESGVRLLTFHASAQRWQQIMPLLEGASASNIAHV